jgi:hypothetical protein
LTEGNSKCLTLYQVNKLAALSSGSILRENLVD